MKKTLGNKWQFPSTTLLYPSGGDLHKSKLTDMKVGYDSGRVCVCVCGSASRDLFIPQF